MARGEKLVATKTRSVLLSLSFRIRSPRLVPSSAAGHFGSLSSSPCSRLLWIPHIPPANLPPPSCCSAPDPNPSRHPLLTQGLLLPGQQVGHRLTHTTPLRCSREPIPPVSFQVLQQEIYCSLPFLYHPIPKHHTDLFF